MKFPVVWRGLAALAATLLLIHCQVATASEVGSEVVSDRQQSDKKNELLLERNDKEVTDLEVELALADNNEAHPYIHSRNRRTLGAVFDMFRDLMSNMFGGGGKKKPRRPRPGYGAPAPTQGYGAPKPTQGYGAPKPTQGYGAPPQVWPIFFISFRLLLVNKIFDFIGGRFNDHSTWRIRFSSVSPSN